MASFVWKIPVTISYMLISWALEHYMQLTKLTWSLVNSLCIRVYAHTCIRIQTFLSLIFILFLDNPWMNTTNKVTNNPAILLALLPADLSYA